MEQEAVINMSRSVLAVGIAAVRQSVEILASVQIGDASGVMLEPGAQWRGDRMLLSVGAASVRFVAGSTLYEQDQDGFLLEEFPGSGTAGTQQAPWLMGLSRFEMPLCMGLAGTLAPAWTDTTSACSYLDRFSHFYRNNRTHVELAARELRYVLEGLFALQHWPALFASLMDSMGDRARGSLPNGMAAMDVGAFLGRLLIGTGDSQVTLARLPQCLRAMREPLTAEAEECMGIPQYQRMIENLERSAERVSPVLQQLRDAL
jgi:hypothetical protein